MVITISPSPKIILNQSVKIMILFIKIGGLSYFGEFLSLSYSFKIYLCFALKKLLNKVYYLLSRVSTQAFIDLNRFAPPILIIPKFIYCELYTSLILITCPDHCVLIFQFLFKIQHLEIWIYKISSEISSFLSLIFSFFRNQ